MESKISTNWQAQKIEDVLIALDTSNHGLSPQEADIRLARFGRNELPTTGMASVFSLLATQFKNVLMLILLFAALVSLMLGEWLDAGVIGVATLLNIVLGFVEEYKADRSLFALKSFLPQFVFVERAGIISQVDARFIVVGDVIYLMNGDSICADARILACSSLLVNEATLTGESQAVKKDALPVDISFPIADQRNMVFAGTTVIGGKAKVVVVATAQKTQFGQISAMVAVAADKQTPLQIQLTRFSVWLGLGATTLASSVFVFGVVNGLDALQMFKIAVAIAVSAIPEGLVVTTTVVLALGMQRILKKKALVRKLVATETLGSVSIICMDKTGTLTQGQMAVSEMRDASGKILQAEERKTLRRILGITNMAICHKKNNIETCAGSPTEVALASEYLPHKDTLGLAEVATITEMPFDSTVKFKAGVYLQGVEKVFYAIGAPDVLLEKINATDNERMRFERIFIDMTQQGLRVLLVVTASVENQIDYYSREKIHDVEVVGFIGLSDPLRESASATVAQARAAGLTPIMITGDHASTARQVALQVGFLENNKRIVTGAELDAMSDVLLYEELENIAVYARVSPRHKLRIVSAWKQKGESVAMVGDGVNDAPAMKVADIGIALGSGTTVAKETADMVLLDDNFQTIIEAIKEGRTIFDNIRKMIVYLLADSFSEVLLVFGAIIFSLPLPILPAQILWINLITDGFPSIALTFEPAENGIMREPPRNRKAQLIDSEMKILIFVIGILCDAILFGVYVYLNNQQMILPDIRTVMFAALGVNSLIYVFSVRKFRSSVFSSNILENTWLLWGVSFGFLLLVLPIVFVPLQKAFEFTALALWEWLIIISLGIIQLLLIELVKMFFNKKHGIIKLNT